MAHEAFFESAPVSAKAQTEANATGGPEPGKFGPPTTDGDSMDFVEDLEPAREATAASAGANNASGSGQELRAAVRAQLLRGTKQGQIARHAGVSDSVLSRWLSESYTGDNAAIERRIVDWFAATEKTMPGDCEPIPSWVQTPTATAIEAALDYARSRPSIAVVYGGAGVGKTTAITRYARAKNDVWVVTATPSSSSMLEVLRAIYEAMTKYRYRCEEKRSRDISRMIFEQLQWSRGRGLLIIDEAQHLELSAVEELRSLHDGAGVGLALSGNESVYRQLTGGTRRAEFAQLFSRVGKPLRLDKPAEGDVTAILHAWRIEGAKEREFCQKIASMPGGLRGLTNVLLDATTVAHSLGSAVDLKALRAAWADLRAAA